MKDIELQKYYENYLDMFSTPGWKQLEEDLNDSQKSYLEDMVNALPDNYQRIQGRVQQIRYILNFKDATINAYEQLREEEVV